MSVKDEPKESIDINDIIDDVLELTRTHREGQPHSEHNRVEIVRDFGDDIRITGNRTEIHEIVLNLLLNAFDAMPEGGRIEILTRKTSSAINIAIKNNGTGMSEEVCKKCCEPFFTTKGEKGTGMGLAMVNTIVADHGGSINIESVPGKGTVITVMLPFDRC